MTSAEPLTLSQLKSLPADVDNSMLGGTRGTAMFMRDVEQEDMPKGKPRCQELYQKLVSKGLVDALLWVDLSEYHMLGQLIGYMLNRMPASQRHKAFSQVGNITTSVIALTHNGGTGGLIHASAWISVGEGYGSSRVVPGPITSQITEWDVRSICADMSGSEATFNCFHGVGHGALWHHSGNMISPCEPYATLQPVSSAIFEAQYVCYNGAVDDPIKTVSCLDGLFHGYFELEALPPQSDWRFPCAEMQVGVSSFCFSQVFWNGVNNQVWRGKELVSSTVPVQHLCDHGPYTLSWKHQLGCMFGLSSVYYNVYDWIVASDVESVTPLPHKVMSRLCSSFAPTQPSRERHTLPGYYHSSIYCDVLVPKLEKAIPTTQPLVRWCELLVYIPGVDRGTESERLRWMACVSGSLYHALNMMMNLHNFPVAELKKHCQQLREAPDIVPAALVEDLYRYCATSKRAGDGGIFLFHRLNTNESNVPVWHEGFLKGGQEPGYLTKGYLDKSWEWLESQDV